MLQAGRTKNAGGYRFGFNGMEQTKGVQGDGAGTFYDYKNRDYDPWIIRFKRTDALEAKYPFYSPYQFAGNKPIKFIDVDGLEPGMQLNLWATTTQLTLDHASDVSSEAANLRLIHPDWTRARLYATAEWNIWANTATTIISFTDIDDARVIVTTVTRNGDAVHVDGSAAGKFDKAMAAGGLFVPIVSGGALGRSFHSLMRAWDYSNLVRKFNGRVKVADAIWDRGKLAKALGTNGTLDAPHHVIPVSVLENSEMVQQAVEAGFEFNTIKNGIPIPSSLHNTGGHLQYNNKVLKDIKDWEDLNVGYQPKDAKAYLEKTLVPQLKQDLSTKVANNQKIY
jgi:RHS repeat-associated protein